MVVRNPRRPAPPAAASELVQQALSCHRRGRLAEAESLCRQALQLQKDHFGGLTLTGILLAQTGRAAEAAPLLERAARAAVREPSAHNNYGNVLRDLRRYTEALASYQRALALKPDYVDALYNCGVVLYELERFEEALSAYDQAVALQSDHTAAHGNRGATLRRLERHEEALQSYRRALELAPHDAAAHNNLGVALQQLGQLDEALASYARALQLAPRYTEALRNRGNALCTQGSMQAACESYRQALALDPGDAVTWSGLGATLRRAGDFEGALTSYRRALEIDPANAETHYNLGNLLRDRGELEQALEHYQRALAVRPGHLEAWQNQGDTLQRLGRFAEALDSYQHALQVDGAHPWLYGFWIGARMLVCDWRDLDSHLPALLSGIEAGERLVAPFTALALVDSPHLQRQAAQIWMREHCPERTELPRIERPEASAGWARDARIRIGYYSADYYAHATAVLAEELFRRHDRASFEIIAFDFGLKRPDEMTRHLTTAFDRFVDVRELSNLQVAQLSRELQIDIAVDLKGYTLDERAGIFSYRAAPVQVSYLGYPGTMGAAYMDYLIADAALIGEHERDGYTEKIAYLPHSYQVNSRSRPGVEGRSSREQHGLPAQGFVFCCFNNPYKIHPSMFEVWMRVLERVPDSVLWLLDNGAAACANLRAAAHTHGVDPARLVFAPRATLPQHLGRHSVADLFVDTLPYNAHTTASDALWAGLPVVTCAGEAFASRVGASLLGAIGLRDLVTHSLEHYEQLLVELATQPARLAEVRERLARNRLTTPLFDIERYTRHLEDAYRQMYARYRAGLPPEHLFVAA